MLDHVRWNMIFHDIILPQEKSENSWKFDPFGSAPLMSLQFAWMDVCVLPLESYTRHELVPKKSCYSAALKDFDYKTKKQIRLYNFLTFLESACMILYVMEAMLMSLKTVTGKMGGKPAARKPTASTNVTNIRPSKPIRLSQLFSCRKKSIFKKSRKPVKVNPTTI